MNTNTQIERNPMITRSKAVEFIGKIASSYGGAVLWAHGLPPSFSDPTVAKSAAMKLVQDISSGKDRAVDMLRSGSNRFLSDTSMSTPMLEQPHNTDVHIPEIVATQDVETQVISSPVRKT